MVLQRDKNTSIYGFVDDLNTTVHCMLDGKNYVAEVNVSIDANYYWKCEFPSYPGGLQSYTINVSSSAKDYALIENVVFGDVFLCGGQSNMEFSMPGMYDADTEIADADNYPFLRVFSVGDDTSSPLTGPPLDDFLSVELSWSIGSSAVMEDSDANAFTYFSSVCYMTSKYIFNDLLDQGIPIGMVSSNWGGTMIETWMPTTASEACGDTNIETSENFVRPHFYENKKTYEIGAQSFTDTPAVHFNEMIYPLRDMSFKAVLWYQGESNTGINTDIYPCLQENMLDAWHSLGDGWEDIPILFVQLAPWDAGGTTEIAEMRWAQYMIPFAEGSNSYIISAADLGDPDSPYGDIHPRNKDEVGRRLSLAASSALYGQLVPHSGPLVIEGGVLDDDTFGAYLLFDEFSIGDGLQLQDAQNCPDSSICGYHYLIYNSIPVLVGSMTIDGNKLFMYPAETQNQAPEKIQYGYCDYPLLTIYNSYNIPLVPFQSDLPFVFGDIQK